MKYAKIVVTVLFVWVAGTFLSAPSKYMQSFLDGVTVWAYNVLPALFPFAVISTIAVKFLPSRFSVSKRLFGVDADAVWAASLLCGYPVGAKSICEGNFDSETATRLCSFCSTASPVFLVATVGNKLLESVTATVVIALSHMGASVLNGLVFRKKCQTVTVLPKFAPSDIGDAVTSATLSVLSVGGLVALFYLLADIVKSYLPLALQQSVVVGFLLGLLEMTNGVIAVCKGCELFAATVLSAFLLAFGGACVFAQSLAFVGKVGVKPVRLLQMKLSQATIATVLAFVLGKILL